MSTGDVTADVGRYRPTNETTGVRERCRLDRRPRGGLVLIGRSLKDDREAAPVAACSISRSRLQTN